MEQCNERNGEARRSACRYVSQAQQQARQPRIRRDRIWLMDSPRTLTTTKVSVSVTTSGGNGASPSQYPPSVFSCLCLYLERGRLARSEQRRGKTRGKRGQKKCGAGKENMKDCVR